MKSGLYFVVLVVWAYSGAIQASIEKEMTQIELEATGISKLSVQELARLNLWLEQRQILRDQTPALISARILGEFEGWDGDTRFRLDNGQLWQQRVGGRYRVPVRTNPEVEIERSRFGHYLKVVETGRMVGVYRIR
jgi:hypothetical protein